MNNHLCYESVVRQISILGLFMYKFQLRTKGRNSLIIHNKYPVPQAAKADIQARMKLCEEYNVSSSIRSP